MDNQRDRIIKLTEYLSSLGIELNVAKNKARGHKGIFIHTFDCSRIDISKNLSEKELLSVMLHEFAHYIHYCYDKSLKNLDFIFDDFSDELREELIQITVSEIPKTFARSIFEKKEQANKDLRKLESFIKKFIPDFKLSKKDTKIEQNLPYPYKYLLKYDKIKYLNNIYSIDNLDEFNLPDEEKLYVKIKSKQRYIKKCNSKINRINKYYNNPSELFARFIDSYYTKPEYTERIAPKAAKKIRLSENLFLKKLNAIFF